MELRELGFPVLESVVTGVFTEGSLQDCWMLNLKLRTGLRVLYHWASFEAEDGDALYEEAKELAWEDWLDANGYVSIIGSIENETINNTQFANMRLKDALVDRIRAKSGSRPNSGPDTSRSVVFLYWHGSEVMLYWDTSGIPLSNRGYRKQPGKAPMRENLAASVIMATTWDRKKPFVNPMCGSGTLAIEAALMAGNRAPGLLRDNFGFMHLKGFDFEAYRSMRRSVDAEKVDKPEVRILASDIDAEMVAAARNNARNAGVEDLIEFEVGDYRQTAMPDTAGVLVVNPEYGERLGDKRKLQRVYGGLGDFFKQNAPGFWAYIFTGNMKLSKRVGLRTRRRIEFYNSQIECRLLEYELYEGSRKNPQSDSDY